MLVPRRKSSVVLHTNKWMLWRTVGSSKCTNTIVYCGL